MQLKRIEEQTHAITTGSGEESEAFAKQESGLKHLLSKRAG
jgi:hypothetical protein